MDRLKPLAANPDHPLSAVSGPIVGVLDAKEWRNHGQMQHVREVLVIRLQYAAQEGLVDFFRGSVLAETGWQFRPRNVPRPFPSNEIDICKESGVLRLPCLPPARSSSSPRAWDVLAIFLDANQ